MALPNSPPLTMAQVAAEFNRQPPVSFASLLGVAPGVPTAAPLTMSDFLGKSSEFLLTISNRTVSANIRNLAVAAGWDQVGRLVVDVTADETCDLQWIGSFPSGGKIIVRNRVGGTFGNPASTLSGGRAMLISSPVEIENRGRIWAGGGAGGRGGDASVTVSGTQHWSYGGDGGSGEGYVLTGTQLSSWALANAQRAPVTPPAYVGPSVGSGSPTAQGGTGGAGGTAGNAGATGLRSSYSLGSTGTAGYDEYGFAGGVAGIAIQGIANVTWIMQGDIRGRLT